jgi:type IV secretion system protein VirB11
MLQAAPVFLDAYLAPLAAVLRRDDVTDVYINRPQEFWVELLDGSITMQEATDLNEKALERLARQIAALSHQGINREFPLLSAILPDGSRVQIIAPPATRHGYAIAIRKHLIADRSLSDYAADGAFDGTARSSSSITPDDRQLEELAARRDFAQLLRAAVLQKRNILVSGGTSSGKTTFLNSLLREVPPDERLIVIEDTPEVQLRQPNAAGLLAVRSPLGETLVSSDDLLTASLRLRPDRIIVGELRGREAFTFLRSVNTGHPGSMTTIHADSTERAVEQMALLVLQSGTTLRRDDIIRHVESVIDVYVQLGRRNGRRVVTEVRLSQPGPLGASA